MKNLICFLLFAVSAQVILCQNMYLYYSYSSDKRLHINELTGEYRIWEKSEIDLVEPKTRSEGKVFTNSDSIICIDNNKREKIILEKIDQYQLRIINNNKLFENKEVLYPIKISTKEGIPLQWLSWKNQNRHGEWICHLGDSIKKIKYKQGMIMDSCIMHRKKYYDLNVEFEL